MMSMLRFQVYKQADFVIDMQKNAWTLGTVVIVTL